MMLVHRRALCPATVILLLSVTASALQAEPPAAAKGRSHPTAEEVSRQWLTRHPRPRDDAEKRIRMYCHGPHPEAGGQKSCVALSSDGISFECRPEVLGESYFRVIPFRGEFLALGMPGHFYRSKDGITGFVKGPTLFTKDQRHTALKLEGEILSVFHSNAHDCPERILVSTIDTSPDWTEWKVGDTHTALSPELDYEGADLPPANSVRGWAPERVRQLRDPGIFEEGGRTYLLYSVAGEHGIAIAEIKG